MAPRLCFVCLRAYGYFNPSVEFHGGGAERQIHLLSTALAEDYDVHVVVGDFGQPKTEVRDGVTLHRAYPLHPRKNALQPAKHLGLLWRAMRRSGADIFISRQSPRKAGFVYALARSLRSKFLYHLANDSYLGAEPASRSQPVQWLYGRAVRHADVVVAQTPKQQSGIKDKYDVAATVIPNGYPPADNRPEFEARDGFLWVGRLDEEQKRPDLFLDLAEALPQLSFRIAGPTRDTEYADTVIDRAQSLSNVQYLGLLDPEEIHDQYRTAIALVSTSAYEGFPNTFLEAWRQGTPILSLTVDPTRFSNDSEGLIGAVESVGSLAEQCEALVSNTNRWHKLSLQSLRCFEEQYTIEAVANRYSSIIDDCIEGFTTT